MSSVSESDGAHDHSGLTDASQVGEAQNDGQKQIATTAESDLAGKFIKALEGLLYSTKHRGRLNAAAALSNYNQIVHCMNQGVDVNTRNQQGEAAIILTTKAWKSCLDLELAKALQLCVDITRRLIDGGADLNAQDRGGRTPLILAIQTGRPNEGSKVEGLDDSFIKLLVEAGACLDPPSQSDCTWPTTPLIAAVSKRRLSAVKLLLSKNAGVNNSIGGQNALHIAVRDGGELFPERLSAIVSLLLQHGADVKSDERKVLAAAISHSPESVEHFLSKCYGTPRPALHPDHHSEDFEAFDYPKDIETPEKLQERSPDAPIATEAGLHRPLWLDRRNPITGSLIEVFRPFVKGQRSVRSFLGKRGETIRTKEAKIEELCSSCSAFQKEAKYREWFIHSPDSKSLFRSISGGCAMCRLIKDCLPNSFGAVSLYYYSALSESDSLSKDYYERIIVRGQVPDNTVYGEIRLATVDDETATALAQASGYDDSETNSEPAFQLISHWMATCLKNHGSACRLFRDSLPSLPTRVIDVGPSDGARDPYLFISNGKQERYTTLSYCWGARANLCTNTLTLDSFTRSIPFKKIPKTIQEAISTTRKLGIRYLWVDTLCILQDSIEDWRREAENIASIYRNCVLTIAAADSVDSEGGLFRNRMRLRTRPVQISPQICPLSRSKSPKCIFAFGDRQESNDGFRCESRLDKRGWVVQEQLLSPRTLNFSSQELYWECPALLASESYPAGIPRDHDRNFERRYFMELRRKMVGDDLPYDKDRVHMLWQHIVVLYSKRELSRETDKLVALAGAANRLSELLDDNFLAGLWIKRLWRDLLWHVDRNTTAIPSGARSTEFRAPSWSWASIKGPISYLFPQGTSYLRYYPCIQVLGYGEKIHAKSNNVSGFIAIRGVILPATIPSTPSRLTSTHGKPGPGRMTTQLGTTWSKREGYHAGPTWEPDTEDNFCGDILCLIVAASHQYIVGLGLQPTGRRLNEYQRIGRTYWSTRWYPIPDEVEFRVVTIV